MALKAKLDLLNLSEEERLKAETKFLATLALISEEELREGKEYLNSQNVQITKAKQIKVLGDSKAVMAKKFSILGEIHEEGIYVQDPTMIPRNAIDIYKKIQYCKQIGKPYKKEDGTYEQFLFSEKAWQKEFNKENDMVVEDSISVQDVEENIVTLEPVINPEYDNIIQFENIASSKEPVIEDTIRFEDPIVEPEEDKVISFESAKPVIEEEKYIDIKDYNKATNEMKKIEEKTTDFATIRAELEGQLAELDQLRNFDIENDDVISFNDLEPETYGGRAA